MKGAAVGSHVPPFISRRGADLRYSSYDVLVVGGGIAGLTAALGAAHRWNVGLITKGTLTGVVDRLEARGLVERMASPTDGRSTLVRLTAQGDRVFREVFEPHLAYLAPAFESLPECGRKELEKRLRQLREALEKRSDELGRQD